MDQTIVMESTANLGEDPEKKKSSSKKRIGMLIGVLVISVVTRLILKDPVERKKADHSAKPFKALPGMLNNLTAEQRAALDPQIIQKMKAADEDFKRSHGARVQAAPLANVAAPAVPAQVAAPKDAPKAPLVQQKVKEVRTVSTASPTGKKNEKTTVVKFRNGGAVMAERVDRFNNETRIQVNKSIQMTIPNRMITSVSDDVAEYQEVGAADAAKASH